MSPDGPTERFALAEEQYEAVLEQIEIDGQLADESRGDPETWSEYEDA